MTKEEKRLTPEEKVFLEIIQELFLKRGLTKAGEIILADQGFFVKYPSYFSFSDVETGIIITKKLLKEKKRREEEKN